MPAFILASRSPRRKELLERAGFRFAIHDPNITEIIQPHEQPTDYVLRNAQEKSYATQQHLKNDFDAIARTLSPLLLPSVPLVVSADTIVVTQDGLVLEKPSDSAHALTMLSFLSGQSHFVHTGFCIAAGGQILHRECVTSQVFFRPIPQEERTAYVSTPEPYDKAGGYGIQDRGALFVERIEGSYTNVMGLPLSQVTEALRIYGHLKWYQEE